MLRLLRSGAGSGSPGPAARLVALLLVIGLLAGIAPFLAQAFLWVADLL